MPNLIAQGALQQHRWRRGIAEGASHVLGRSAGGWSTPWDEHISRRHVEIECRQGRLFVRKLLTAKNPVFYRGEKQQQFSIGANEHFVIGGTTFTLVDDKADVSLAAPSPVTEQSYSPQYLSRVAFRDAASRIDVLSRLPEIIAETSGDEELFSRLVNVVLTGVGRASTVAIVAAAGEHARVLHWDRRTVTGGDFSPSARLIHRALATGESVVHVWSGEGSSAYTAAEQADWAFCTPVPGRVCQGWAIYVAGRQTSDLPQRGQGTDPHDLRDDVKFTEIAAVTLGNVQDVRHLERRQAGLAQFFSPVVIEALSAAEDPAAELEPRQVEVSVLFCDLRGFSRESERSSDDLLGLLARVSDALGITTRNIFAEQGVVGDFHGDAAMGFWGWPIKRADASAAACRAALAIRQEFSDLARRQNHPLADFQMGLGIATGTAVAGKIGTADQVKITVFGPVVNLASRLESMTRQLRTPILIEETAAQAARNIITADVARFRRVAKVRPYGMQKVVEVSEILPPESDYPQFSSASIAAYEAGLDAFYQGDWETCLEKLHDVPAHDRVKDFLTVFIARHDRTPPTGWDGVISLTSR